MQYPPSHESKYNTLRWLKGMTQIIHPYMTSSAGNYETLTVSFEGETLNGKPHGLCLLTFKEQGISSFRGAGMMKEG